MKEMTFGEKRRAIRALRSAHAEMRQKLADVFQRGGFEAMEVDDVSITLPRDTFEQCEWALGYVKQWIRDVDEETGELLPTGRYCRMSALYADSRISRGHFLLKNRPVFCGD